MPDALEALRRRRGLVLGSVTGAILVSVILVLVWPPTYASRVRFLVKAPVQISGPEDRQVVRSDDVNTEAAILTSATVMEEASQRLGNAGLRGPRIQELWSSAVLLLANQYASWMGVPGEPANGRAVRKLRAALEVHPIPDSKVIEAKLYWHDPSRGRTILEEISTSYFRAHLAVHRTAPLSTLLLEQVQSRETELTGIEDEIRRIRPDASLESARLQRELLMRQASEFGAETRRTTALRQEAEARFRQQTGELLKDEAGISSEELRRTAIAARVDSAGFNERLEEYRNAVEAYESLADQLGLENFQIGRLERKRKAAEEAYLRAWSQFSDARHAEAIQSANVVDVAMIEPVRSDPLPVTPPILSVLFGIPILGVFLGFVLAWAAELLDRRIYTSIDSERHLGLHALAEVPDAKATGRT